MAEQDKREMRYMEFLRVTSNSNDAFYKPQTVSQTLESTRVGGSGTNDSSYSPTDTEKLITKV